MNSVFHIVGHHLDLYDKITNKYVGSVEVSVDNYPDRVHGYAGRTTERINANARRNGGKLFPIQGQFITELMPVCGKIKGSTLQERIQVIKEHYQKQPYGRQNRG